MYDKTLEYVSISSVITKDTVCLLKIHETVHKIFETNSSFHVK